MPDTAAKLPHVEQLAALRRQGAARHDPQCWGFIEALARRSQGHDGPARALLDARLDRALADFQARWPQPEVPGRGAAQALLPARPAHGGLSGLVQALRQPLGDDPQQAGDSVGRTLPRAAAAPVRPAELKALSYFRRSWAQLSLQQQLQHSQAQLPAHAGPLNSQALALRALMLMQDIAPAYLSCFMGHVDSLLWLDQAQVRPPAAAPSGRLSRGKTRG